MPITALSAEAIAHAVSLAANRLAGLVYPDVDPRLPVELEDGTPCRVTDWCEGSDYLQIELLEAVRPGSSYHRGIAGRHSWHMIGGGRYDGARAGEFLRLRNVGVEWPSASPDSLCLPIDPRLPLELEDRTPLEVISLSLANPNPQVCVRPLAVPHERYQFAGEADAVAHSWWHSLTSGEFIGSPDLLRVRNVDPAAPALEWFDVVAGLPGVPRDQWEAIAEGFIGGKAAADKAGELRETYKARGLSVAVRKRPVVDPSADPEAWKEREALRLSDGTYRLLPGNWQARVASLYPLQFVHVSQSDHRKVAFTESEAAGQADRQKVLSATAYAARYLSSWLTGDEYQTFLSDMLGDSVPVLFSPLGDAEALTSLYVECGEGKSYELGAVGSCMAYPASRLSRYLDVHPVSVYAKGGDLTLAFLRGSGSDLEPIACGWDDTSKPISARCLVWPERKLFARVYGRQSFLLRSGLKALGYREDLRLNGARLAHIPVDDAGADAVHMPYLDIGECTFSWSDDGDCFVAGGHAFSGGSTAGFAYASAQVECESCNDNFAEGDAREVMTGEHESEIWCPGCVSDYACTSEHSDRLFHHAHSAEWRGATAHYSMTVANWELEANGGDLAGVWVDYRDEWREDGFYCVDCGEGYRASEQGGEIEHGDPVCFECWAERLANDDSNETEQAA